MNVELLIHQNAREFLDIVGGDLYESESVNSLILGIAERLINYPQSHANPFFVSLTTQSGAFVLAALMTPPHNMILAGGNNFQEGFPLLFSYLEDQPINFPGLIGPKQMVEQFAESWRKKTNQDYQPSMYQRVYELRSVRMPAIPPGAFQAARIEHIPVIASLLQKFDLEAIGENNPIDPERARRLINGGYVFVWEKDGEIVSMAMKTRPIAHSTGVGGVYTPPELRRQGYATALVAFLSQYMLDQGYDFVTLFTDLDNPTSNDIYMKIGYRPVCDFEQINFYSSK
jgi:predicted GNAT family acetyltransferase